MTEIKNINFNETFAVRHPVLRAGKPIECCFFDGDDLKTTAHFGLFDNSKLTGVISVFQNKNSIFRDENQFQIRGMAVLKESQGKQFGKQLLEHAENQVLSENGDLIWFNARENAVLFYKNSGYAIWGDSFEIENIGTHYIMHKNLRQ